jgi:hypothetical protein
MNLTVEEIKRLKLIWDRLQKGTSGVNEWYWVCSANWWHLHELQAKRLGLRIL